MSHQTKNDRRRAIEEGKKRFGDDFFMVDPRGGVSSYSASLVTAAPFRVRTEKDEICFVDWASPVIPWVASQNARYEEQPKAMAAGVM